MAKPVLIFPAGMPRALEYLQRSIAEGVQVVGSSSLAHDPSRDKYPVWAHLPLVTSPDFNQELTKTILQMEIGSIYTPNIVVWDHLSRVLADILPGIKLVNRSPVEDLLAPYQAAQTQAAVALDDELPLACETEPKPPLSKAQLASLYKHANAIPGMCDNEKLRALLEIFRYATQGDVVEIGSWWGKSAFILLRLAQCYGVGKLLCVDPWSNEHLIQGEALVDSSSAQVDASEALTIFEMNLLPYGLNQINFLRMASVDGAAHYRTTPCANTEAFGVTKYEGHIAVLHIDGNHSYLAVKGDVEAWAGLVKPGGWIIIDDYIWPYGDGPQQAGNEFLTENQARIDVAFVIGSALFIQLCS